MVTSADCLKKYGNPNLQTSMVVWDIPTELEQGLIPHKLYCNKDMVKPLSQAFKNIIDRKLVSQIKSFDGCFNIRQKRGGTTYSLHSWGIAIDINASTNKMGTKGDMSDELGKCFVDAGFEWGRNWSTPDSMHFQLAKI